MRRPRSTWLHKSKNIAICHVTWLSLIPVLHEHPFHMNVKDSSALLTNSKAQKSVASQYLFTHICCAIKSKPPCVGNAQLGWGRNDGTNVIKAPWLHEENRPKGRELTKRSASKQIIPSPSFMRIIVLTCKVNWLIYDPCMALYRQRSNNVVSDQWRNCT